MSGKPFSLEECKIQAAILLKNLQSSDSKTSQMATSRIQKLLEYTSINNRKLDGYKLKHCLQAIAIEYGFSSWNGLKFYFTTTVNTQLPTRGGFLHKWFATYKEARANFSAMNEFLFPYKNHFFIATASYVEYLGISITNPDWACIGDNWVEPQDIEAWKRLCWHLNKKVEVQMAKSLPKAKFLQGIFEPLSFESNINDCTIIGEIPQELSCHLLFMA